MGAEDEGGLDGVRADDLCSCVRCLRRAERGSGSIECQVAQLGCRNLSCELCSAVRFFNFQRYILRLKMHIYFYTFTQDQGNPIVTVSIAHGNDAVSRSKRSGRIADSPCARPLADEVKHYALQSHDRAKTVSFKILSHVSSFKGREIRKS